MYLMILRFLKKNICKIISSVSNSRKETIKSTPGEQDRRAVRVDGDRGTSEYGTSGSERNVPDRPILFQVHFWTDGHKVIDYSDPSGRVGSPDADQDGQRGQISRPDQTRFENRRREKNFGGGYDNGDKSVGLGPILQSSISAEKLFGSLFILKLRTNFHPKTTDFCLSDNYGH
jgi:hypothetical protein